MLTPHIKSWWFGHEPDRHGPTTGGDLVRVWDRNVVRRTHHLLVYQSQKRDELIVVKWPHYLIITGDRPVVTVQERHQRGEQALVGWQRRDHLRARGWARFHPRRAGSSDRRPHSRHALHVIGCQRYDQSDLTRSETRPHAVSENPGTPASGSGCVQKYLWTTSITPAPPHTPASPAPRRVAPRRYAAAIQRDRKSVV